MSVWSPGRSPRRLREEQEGGTVSRWAPVLCAPALHLSCCVAPVWRHMAAGLHKGRAGASEWRDAGARGEEEEQRMRLLKEEEKLKDEGHSQS